VTGLGCDFFCFWKEEMLYSEGEERVLQAISLVSTTKGNNFVYRFLKYSCYIQHCNILRSRPSLCRAICKACAVRLKPTAHGRTDVGVFKAI